MDHLPRPHVTSEYLHYIAHRCGLATRTKPSPVCPPPTFIRAQLSIPALTHACIVAARYFALPKTVVFAEVPADLSGLPAALDDAFEGAASMPANPQACGEQLGGANHPLGPR